MAGSLPIEKLNRNNYASWSYKMHQYLFGQGYWSYVEGANEVVLPAGKGVQSGKRRVN